MVRPSPYERSSILSKKEIGERIIWVGYFMGLGATVGLSLFFVHLGFIAKEVNLVPVVDSFVSKSSITSWRPNPNVQH